MSNNIAIKKHRPSDARMLEAHFIGVSEIRLGDTTYYDLSEQANHPWFVLVLRNGIINKESN